MIINQEGKKEKRFKIKKPVKITAVICATLLLAGASVYATGAADTVFGTISKEDAKAIALEQVSGAKDSDVTKCSKDFDDGREEYDVEIIYNGYEYDFEISAEDGKILDRSREIADDAENDKKAYGGSLDGMTEVADSIGLEQAKSIALGQVSGATSANIVKAHSDNDDGRQEYDIEIHYNGYEYEFEIDGVTGAILSRDTDPIHDSDSDRNDDHDNDSDDDRYDHDDDYDDDRYDHDNDYDDDRYDHDDDYDDDRYDHDDDDDDDHDDEDDD